MDILILVIIGLVVFFAFEILWIRPSHEAYLGLDQLSKRGKK